MNLEHLNSKAVWLLLLLTYACNNYIRCVLSFLLLRMLNVFDATLLKLEFF